MKRYYSTRQGPKTPSISVDFNHPERQPETPPPGQQDAPCMIPFQALALNHTTLSRATSNGLQKPRLKFGHEDCFNPVYHRPQPLSQA